MAKIFDTLESLNLLDTQELNKSYENSLKKIDATDTLIAIAEK